MTTEMHTLAEIQSQPQAWAAVLAYLQAQRAAIAAQWQAGRYEQVLVTGCGSPYYAALAVAAGLRERGIAAQALPASEIWLNPAASYVRRSTLLVALSRSGATTEVLRACAAFGQTGLGDVLTISCYPAAPLASAGQLNLILEAGQEQSFAQTRAFSALYLAGVACAAIWQSDEAALTELGRLPAVAADVLPRSSAIAQSLGSDAALDRYYFLGSGARHGLACEMSLKMKEMSLSHSEPFHFLEFRHGPQTMVNEHTLVIGLVSDQNRSQEMSVLNDVSALGGQVLTIGEHDLLASFNSGVSEPLRNALYLLVGQQLAYYHAVGKGLNPDRPHNLQAVVKL